MVLWFTRRVQSLQAQSIGIAALIVACAGIVSRVLGLIRDRLLAGSFGAGDALDIYYAAFRFPDLLFELVVLGSLSAAFIPVFTKLWNTESREAAWSCARNLLVVIFFVMASVSLFGMIFAEQFLRVIAPGFDATKLQTTVELTRILLASPVLLSLSALLGGILVSLRHFLLYALAPIFYNLGIIAGILFLVPLWGLHGLAYGVVLGASLHFLVHIFATHLYGFRLRGPEPVRPLHNDSVKDVLRLMLPRIFGSASQQISLVMITFFASALGAGSIAIFTFANNIQSVVLGLVGVPFALAAFPVLSAAYSKKDDVEFTKVYLRTLKRILYYTLPLSGLLFVLRAQVTRVIYGVGAFDWQDTVLTFTVMGVLCFSLFAQCAVQLFARTFYAMHDTWTPLYVGLGTQGVQFVTAWFFLQHSTWVHHEFFLGAFAIAVSDDEAKIVALAAAFTVAVVINAVVLFALLHRKLRPYNWRALTSNIVRIFAAFLLAIACAQLVKTVIGQVLFPLNLTWQVLVQLVLPGITGLVVYFGATAYLHVEEFQTIRNRLLIRLFGRSSVAGEEQNID